MLSLRRAAVPILVTTVLLALHRAFFAQAMALKPQNPLDTPYGHSFITVYKCAWRVIETTSYSFKRNHQLMSRVWMTWSFSFNSAVSNSKISADVRLTSCR